MRFKEGGRFAPRKLAIFFTNIFPLYIWKFENNFDFEKPE